MAADKEEEIIVTWGWEDGGQERAVFGDMRSAVAFYEAIDLRGQYREAKAEEGASWRERAAVKAMRGHGAHAAPMEEARYGREDDARVFG